MATITRRLTRALEREAPSWGIPPVPPERRTLSGLDLGVLWGDLSLGLLVLLTGSLLVPSLGLPQAVLAIVVGTLLGCIPLGLVGLAGAKEGVAGMVLFRPLLGARGSYLPSLLNIVQLVGWTGFEFWAMTVIADQMSRRLFGHSSYWVWLAVVAAICTALALGGPVLVVRRWLERFGAWVLAGIAAWITATLLSSTDLAEIWRRSPTGGFPGTFWLAVDLVIAMPVSWVPLVADYNRFARGSRSSAIGTYTGYALGNVWFYGLGAVLVLAGRLTEPSPAGLGFAIASVGGGWLVLLVLLAGETDEAFADIYSAAVSSQNLQARIPQRAAILAVAGAGAAMAAWLGGRPFSAVGAYESFLFLLGSVFVPLFGVFIADYFLLRRPQRSGRTTLAVQAALPLGDGTHRRAFASWIVGFAVYQWSVPTGPTGWQDAVRTVFEGWLHLPFPLAGSRLGASLPAFAVALAAYVVLTLVSSGAARRPEGAPGARRMHSRR